MACVALLIGDNGPFPDGVMAGFGRDMLHARLAPLPRPPDADLARPHASSTGAIIAAAALPRRHLQRGPHVPQHQDALQLRPARHR